jgi:Tfp pilus assembly protein PilV
MYGPTHFDVSAVDGLIVVELLIAVVVLTAGLLTLRPRSTRS